MTTTLPILVAVAVEGLLPEAPLIDGATEREADCGHAVMVAPTGVAMIERGEVARVVCTGCATVLLEEHGTLDIHPLRADQAEELARTLRRRDTGA